MRDYIPDMTERYPEGLDGVDMFAPRDLEALAWAELDREYHEAERQQIEEITRAGYEIIKQTADGWTLAESGGFLLLFIIDPLSGEIVSLYDGARNNPENLESMIESWEESAK